MSRSSSSGGGSNDTHDDVGTVMTTATFRQDIPKLYQAALIRRWNIVASRAQNLNHPEEARYADPTPRWSYGSPPGRDKPNDAHGRVVPSGWQDVGTAA